MAVYKCGVCGCVLMKKKKEKVFSELETCPICKQLVSKFEKIDNAQKQKTVPGYEGELAYEIYGYISRRRGICKYKQQIKRGGQKNDEIYMQGLRKGI